MYSSNTNLKSHTSRLLARAAAIALSVGTLYTGMATPAFAQYNPPSDLGLPSRREPGGTRGACPAASSTQAVPVDGLSLTPLLPQDNHFGQTLSPYPTFYWYVPAIAAQSAEFVLMDESENEVYTVKFQMEPTEAGGLMSLSLPENAGLPPLELDKTYHWYFSLICNEFDRGADIFTEGWVRRVQSASLSTLDDLASWPQPTSANEYAQEGIWFEALEIVAEGRRMQGESFSSPEWQLLLESVGLSAFTDVAFIQ